MKFEKDQPAEFRHIDDMEWETLRFPGQHSKMLFHPRPEDPTQPNAGFVRYEDILEGKTFKVGSLSDADITGAARFLKVENNELIYKYDR